MPDNFFAIYSTDALDPIDPTTATDFTYFDQDPMPPGAGEYDSMYEWAARGSHIPTLGGRVDQDYGLNEKDRKILIRDTDALSDATVRALEKKFAARDTDWLFTDGMDVFRVRFSRVPLGLKCWKNIHLWQVGRSISNPPPPQYVRYSYEILLHVLDALAGEDFGLDLETVEGS